MPSRIAMLACYVLIGLISAASAARAQDAAAAGKSDQRAVAIPVADILSRADADERFAADVRGRVAGRDPNTELARRRVSSAASSA